MTYQANVKHLVSKLNFKIGDKARRLSNPDGPAGRFKKLQKTVTALIKYERIELRYNRADEARGYVERVSFSRFSVSLLLLIFIVIYST